MNLVFILCTNGLFFFAWIAGLDGFRFVSHKSGIRAVSSSSLTRSCSFLKMAASKPPGNHDDFNFGSDDDDDDDDDNENLDEKPGTGSNEWDSEVAGSFDEESLPSLSRVFAVQLEEGLEETVTDMAIKTAKYYMEEFRDDVSLQYISNFKDYSSKGFGTVGWRGYIEDMIKTDKHDVYVTLVPPPSLLRSQNLSTTNKNIRVQYTVKIEPRKIAHQIVTVRENVCNELMEDLRSIRNENNEAARFAGLWTSSSLEAAQKARRPSRVATEGTPHRDRNFCDLDLLVTNFAIDLFKSDYLHLHANPKEHQSMVEYLVNMLTTISEEFEAKDPMYKLLNKYRGPQTLLENLYHNGLESPVGEAGQGSINRLKLAQEVFKLRLIVANEACRSLSNIVLSSRAYYKLIKDHGGFSRIDLSGRPKYTIVDLDVEEKKERERRQALAEAQAIEQQRLEMEQNTLERQKAENARELEVLAAEAARELVRAEDDSLIDPDSFFGSGPMMM